MIFQAIDCVGNSRGVSITKTSVCVENNCLRFSVIVITKIMLHAHDRGSLFAISIVVAGILPLKTLIEKRCIKKCINMQRCVTTSTQFIKSIRKLTVLNNFHLCRLFKDEYDEKFLIACFLTI